MAVTLSTAALNAACDAVVALVDGGAGAGKIQIMDAADTVIAEITLDDPAFGAASGGASAMAGAPQAGAGIAAAGSGTTAVTFAVVDSDDTVIWSGNIGKDTGELDIGNDLVIADLQVVTVASYSYSILPLEYTNVVGVLAAALDCEATPGGVAAALSASALATDLAPGVRQARLRIANLLSECAVALAAIPAIEQSVIDGL